MIYRFGDFTLNVDQESLRRRGEPVSIRGNAFQVLRLLVERAPNLVSRQNILTEVWGHEAISENSIPQVIKDIRKALGDSARTPRYVTTHYGRGYKFISPVTADTGEAPGAAIENKVRPSRSWFIGLLAALFSISILASLLWTSDDAAIGSVAQQPETPWLLRAAPQSEDNDLSGAFAEYLNFVIGSAEGGNTLTLAREDVAIPANAQVLEVLLAVNPDNDNARGRFMLNLHTERELEETPRVTNQPVEDSIEEIFKRLEVDPQTRVASGIISQSPFATETLLRGMAALFAGEFERASTLFQACLEEDPEFDFARYELAIVARKLDQKEKSLALLQTLQQRQSSPFWLRRIHNAQGIVLRELGRFEEAIDSLRIAASNAQPGIQSIAIASNLALLLRDQGYYQEAVTLLEENLAELDQQEHPRMAASGLTSLASIYMRMGRLADAEPALKTSARLFFELGARDGHAAVLSRTAQLYERMGDYSKATHFLSMSTEIREQLGLVNAVAYGKVRLSRLLRAQGDFTQARALANQALEIALDSESLIEQQTANASLAATELAAHNFADAEVFANRAFDIARQRQKPEPLLQTRLGQFSVALARGQNLSTLPDEIRRAITEAGIDDQHYLGQRGQLLIARVAMKLGQKDAARDVLQPLITAAETAQEMELAAEARFSLADSYLPEQPEQALQLLDQAHKQSMTHYPYSLLRAKSLHAIGRSTRALETALEAKQTAGDWWNNEDEAFLQSMMDTQST